MRLNSSRTDILMTRREMTEDSVAINHQGEELFLCHTRDSSLIQLRKTKRKTEGGCCSSFSKAICHTEIQWIFALSSYSIIFYQDKTIKLERMSSHHIHANNDSWAVLFHLDKFLMHLICSVVLSAGATVSISIFNRFWWWFIISEVCNWSVDDYEELNEVLLNYLSQINWYRII